MAACCWNSRKHRLVVHSVGAWLRLESLSRGQQRNDRCDSRRAHGCAARCAQTTETTARRCTALRKSTPAHTARIHRKLCWRVHARDIRSAISMARIMRARASPAMKTKKNTTTARRRTARRDSKLAFTIFSAAKCVLKRPARARARQRSLLLAPRTGVRRAARARAIDINTTARRCAARRDLKLTRASAAIPALALAPYHTPVAIPTATD